VSHSDPELAAAIDALERAGIAAEIYDSRWRLAHFTREYMTIVSAGRRDIAASGLGEHWLSPAITEIRESWPAGPTFESFLEVVADLGGCAIETTPGGLEAVLEFADPRYEKALREAVPRTPPPLWAGRVEVKFGTETIGNDVLVVCLHGADGRRLGFAAIAKPELRASVLGMLALGDARLFERMSGLLKPARRPAAILFADLEGSSPLARRLSTPAYFKLIRRLASGGDRVVVSAGGIVGKHVGDGITALFIAEEGRGESSAARSCIEAMRGIRGVASSVADRSGLKAGEVTMRFGLHWGATLYVARLLTSGRAEVTALGDEMNEAARIEACASGGLALASKPLLERLEPADASALGIDVTSLAYTPLAELASASEKARRDAPAIAVCEL
jgi:class 3 adenylate cyclase